MSIDTYPVQPRKRGCTGPVIHSFGEEMMKILIGACLMLLVAGCIPATTYDPVLTGKDIAISALPEAVRNAVRKEHADSKIISASVIELNFHPDSYLVRIENHKGGSSLLEISPEGHIGKDITEQTPAGDVLKAAPEE